jgi:hypothetical protein
MAAVECNHAAAVPMAMSVCIALRCRTLGDPTKNWLQEYAGRKLWLRHPRTRSACCRAEELAGDRNDLQNNTVGTPTTAANQNCAWTPYSTLAR